MIAKRTLAAIVLMAILGGCTGETTPSSEPGLSAARPDVGIGEPKSPAPVGGAKRAREQAARDTSEQAARVTSEQAVRDVATAPWAPARYAPAFGIEALDGIRVDVSPATGTVSVFETDLVVGSVAVRRAYTAGFGWRAEHEARVRAYEGAYLVERLQGLTLFLPVPGVSGAFAPLWGPEELLRVDEHGFDLLADDGRVLAFDLDGQLTSLRPGYSVRRSNGSLELEGEGGTITVTLDAQGRSTAAASGGHEVRYERNEAGLLARVRGEVRRAYTYAGARLTQVQSDDASLLRVGYDSVGWLESLRAGESAQRYRFEVEDEAIVKATVVTPLGEWVYQITPSAWTISTPRGVETVQFDARGQILSSSRPVERWIAAGHSAPATRRSYDARGRLATVSAGDARESFAYDSVGRLVRQITSDGLVTSYGYQGTSPRASSITTPAGTAKLRYDRAGRMTEVATPGGRRWSRSYDAAGRLTQDDGPMGPVVLKRSSTGRLVGRTDASGREVSVLFDERGRPKQVSAHGETETITYSADDARVELENQTSRLAYTRGRKEGVDALLVEISPPNHEDLALEYGFTGEGERVQTPWGELRRTWDERGDVTRLESFAGTFHFAYDADSRPTRIRFPNGLTTEISRDALGREAQRSSKALSLVSRRDGAQRVVATVRDGASTTYTYDASSRLSGWSSGADAASWTYTADGDRATSQTGDAEARPWTYDWKGRLKSVGADRFESDRAGRIVARRHAGDRDTFAYDGFGRLVEVHRAGRPAVRYSYDPQGRLASRAVDGAGFTDYVYEGDRLLAELGPGERERVYVYGPGLDHPLAYWDKLTRVWTFLHSDRLGTLLAYSDEDGATVASASFSPFGVNTADPGAERPLFFQGRLVDREAGLVNMRARFYDPALGRFLTPDPSGLEGGLNAFAFVENQPLEWTDPLGLWSWSSDKSESSKPGLGGRFLSWVGEKATSAKNTAVGAAQGLQYLTGIGVSTEIRDAARAASKKDITSGRAQSRAVGAIDAYTKFMTFGFGDPNLRRWAYDKEQAKVGEAYGEAGGWAFAVISGKDLPRLLGKGLLATGRGGVSALRALWRTGNRPVGELLRGLGTTLAKAPAALGRLFNAAKSSPGALKDLFAVIGENRGAIGKFLKRAFPDSVLNATLRPFKNLFKFLRHPLREGFSLRHPFTQTLREAQELNRVRQAAIMANRLRALEALRGTNPASQLRNVVDAMRVEATLAKDASRLGQAAVNTARNGIPAAEAVGATGRLEGIKGGGSATRARANAPRAPPVDPRYGIAPPPGLKTADLAKYLPKHANDVQDCGLRSLFGHLNQSGRPVSWEQITNAARQAGIRVTPEQGLRGDQVARLLQELAGGEAALNYTVPHADKARFLSALARQLRPGQQAIVALGDGTKTGGHFVTARMTPKGLRFFDFQSKAALTADDLLNSRKWTELGGVWQPRAIPNPTVPARVPVLPRQFGSRGVKARPTQPAPVASRALRFKGARRIDGLRRATHADITKAFKGTGFKPTNHFIKRVKDLRTERLGLKTFGDLERIFRKGVFGESRGLGTIRYNGFEIIFNPKTRRLVTLKPVSG